MTTFSTTRTGGCSEGSYAGMNINPYCGDTAEHISANRALLAGELGVSEERIFLPHQVHDVKAAVIDEPFLAIPQAAQSEQLEGVDALMTDIKDICIGVSTADCIPVILYAPLRQAAAVIHAGWRGTVQGITGHVTDLFCRRFGIPGEEVKAVIGPGISRKNFEVGQSVYDEFRDRGYPMESIAFMPHQKWHIDLPECNRLQLEERGIPAGSICDCGICTYDHFEQFFSARRQGIASGRIYTGIILRNY